MQRRRRDSIPLFLSPRKKPKPLLIFLIFSPKCREREAIPLFLSPPPKPKSKPLSLSKKHLKFRAGIIMPCSSSSLGSRIRSWLRDYDRIQTLAVLLIYVQIACALIGSLGALFNGVLLVNLVVALFALVAIESSSQSLGRTYAVLLVCAILLDIGWFILFSHTIWKLDAEKYGSFFVFSLRLALLMQVIGFSVRFLSSFLWIQMYILGSSSLDRSISRGADFDVRSSFLNPATNEVGSLNSNNDDFIGAAIYDPAYYSSLFEDTQNKESVNEVDRRNFGYVKGSTSGTCSPQLKSCISRSFQVVDVDNVMREP